MTNANKQCLIVRGTSIHMLDLYVVISVPLLIMTGETTFSVDRNAQTESPMAAYLTCTLLHRTCSVLYMKSGFIIMMRPTSCLR